MIYIWSAMLDTSADQQKIFLTLLSADEIKRADRFRFPIHRQRYIAARGVLRCILGDYLSIQPADICFSYGSQGKPYVEGSDVQFNLSHSHDRAVYAVTYHTAVGVDIEKMQDRYNEAVAKRFFTPDEYEQLQKLPLEQKAAGFYRIWARKEALIKALGKGLSSHLSAFSVSLNQNIEQITLAECHWHLESFVVDPGYESAFAVQQPVENVIYQQWPTK